MTVYSVTNVDREQALAAFERTPVPTSSERLRAARYLAKKATKADRNRLYKFREGERNSWVRHALDQAMIRSEAYGSVVTVEEEETPLDRILYEELRAQAIEETSAMFLHELRPLVGSLERAADADIKRYACSGTKAAIGRVQSFLEAIERLQKATSALALHQFDLTDLVFRVAAAEDEQGRATLDNLKEEADESIGLEGDAEPASQKAGIKLTLARRDPVITTGDPTLVEIAVANALRNAIEAVSEVQESNRRDIILNWGETDVDCWIVILDEGCGLPSGLNRLMEPGASTKSKKQGNFGMGLPIAQRAIQSTKGSIILTPRSGSGASCEIRWPHRDKME